MRKIMLHVIMVLLVIAVCTVMVLGYYTYQAYRHPFPKFPVRYHGGYIFEGDQELGYRAVRNASIFVDEGADGNYHVYTDKRGARVNCEGEQKPDLVSIMVLGCSCSYGYRLRNEDSYAEILSRKFDVSVANFAVPSYGAVQALQMLRRNLDMRPNVVIYTFITDHLERNLLPCARSCSPFCQVVANVRFDEDNKPYLEPPDFKLFDPKLHKKFCEEVVYSEGISYKDVFWKIVADFLRLKKWRDVTGPNDVRDPVQRARSISYLLDEISKTTRDINAKLIVVYLPLLGRGCVEPPPQELLSSLPKDAIFVDITPRAVEYYKNNLEPSRLTVIRDNGHPNEIGQKIIAEELEKVIRKNRLLK